jgi:hypothetical protein
MYSLCSQDYLAVKYFFTGTATDPAIRQGKVADADKPVDEDAESKESCLKRALCRAQTGGNFFLTFFKFFKLKL